MLKKGKIFIKLIPPLVGPNRSLEPPKNGRGFVDEEVGFSGHALIPMFLALDKNQKCH